MADSTGNTGLWASIVAGIPGVGMAAWAIYQKLAGGEKHAITIQHESDDESAALRARANLDDAQKEWFDGMRADLRDKRGALKEAEAEIELWEARARRADRGWIALYHQVLEERITGIRQPLPPIPKLEDPIL